MLSSALPSAAVRLEPSASRAEFGAQRTELARVAQHEYAHVRPRKQRVVRRVGRDGHERPDSLRLAIDRFRHVTNVPAVLLYHPRPRTPKVDLRKRCVGGVVDASAGGAFRRCRAANHECAERDER